MKGRRYGKRVARGLLAGLLGVAACLAVAATPAFPGEAPPVSSGLAQTGSGTSVPQPPAENPAGTPGAASGMRVYVDPQTGGFLKEPAPGHVPLELSPRLQDALSTSHEGLVETPSPVPGGGVKLDLKGRFQSPAFGTIGADGKVRIQHLHEMPASGDKK